VARYKITLARVCLARGSSGRDTQICSICPATQHKLPVRQPPPRQRQTPKSSSAHKKKPKNLGTMGFEPMRFSPVGLESTALTNSATFPKELPALKMGAKIHYIRPTRKVTCCGWGKSVFSRHHFRIQADSECEDDSATTSKN
jgi:hypothetical protein